MKIVQFKDGFSKDDVWSKYESGRIKRSSAKVVTGIGQDAYIAYPFINIYDRGCYIKIAAGSGSDDGQSNLLQKIGSKAVENLEKIISSDNDAASGVKQN